MALIQEVNNIKPKFGRECFLAENSTIIGDVVMGDYCSIWFNAVVRGDVDKIRIGNKVNIQDGAIIHGTYQTGATVIANDVSIGHGAIIHGCMIEEFVLVGMGAIIMDKAIIGKNSIIAAGSLILEGTKVPPGSIYGGVPAKKIGEISKKQSEDIIGAAIKNYLMYAKWYKNK